MVLWLYSYIYLNYLKGRDGVLFHMAIEIIVIINLFNNITVGCI